MTTLGTEQNETKVTSTTPRHRSAISPKFESNFALQYILVLLQVLCRVYVYFSILLSVYVVFPSSISIDLRNPDYLQDIAVYSAGTCLVFLSMRDGWHGCMLQ